MDEENDIPTASGGTPSGSSGNQRSSNDSGDAVESQLDAIIDSIGVADTLTAPLRRSIEGILQLAARTINSDDASVLVRDDNEGGLRFLTTAGKFRDKLKGVRVPPGQGIAGFVFSSGQPMLVNEPSQVYKQIDQQLGYRTDTLLATPLRSGREIIGVLEFVNRPGEPPYERFTSEEMDRASQFADAIAKLVNAYEMAQIVEAFFNHSLRSSLSGPESAAGGDDWLASASALQEHHDLVHAIVTLVEVINRGEPERRLCSEILDSLARFGGRRPAVTRSFLKS